jgi:hypothetical protein
MTKNAKKQPSTMTGIAIALLMIGAALFAGCTSNNTNNNANIPVSYPVLSSTNHAILNNAYEDYEALKQNQSYKEARAQLLEKLNNETGVEKAELGLDNYTIFVTCSDGDFTAVDTFELDEEPSQGIGFSPYTYGGASDDDYLTEHTITFDGVSQEVSEYNHPYQLSKISYDIIIEGPGDRIAPESKKILVLGPCYWEFNKEPIDQCIQQFKGHGWTDDDITVKLIKDAPWESNNDCLTLTPEDYFNLEDYGIILFTGHGGVKVYKNFDETNLYLQFCYLDNASFAHNPQLQVWKNQSKLLIERTYKCDDGGITKFIYSVGIRADLLREMISTLPSSYLYFSTCYGGYFNKVFIDHGAKIFLGWDDKVDATISDTDMCNLATLLLEKNYCVYNAYSDSSITKKEWHDADLSFYPSIEEKQNAYFFYYPSWIDLTVTGITEGTDYLKTTVQNDLGVRAADVEDQVGYGASQIQCEELKKIITPSDQKVIIEVTAYDSGGQEITSAQTNTTLETGENIMQIALEQSGKLTLELDPENGQLDARRTTWYLSIEARYENAPNGNLLYVWDASGAEGLGGFTYNMVQHYEVYDNTMSFYSSGTGTDGTKIPITLSVYLVEGEKRELLETASASIDVYNPMTQYSLVDQDDKTGWGAGSWEFYNWGHGSVGYEFYARSGDQIRIVCVYKGYYAEWEHPQVYLKQGETKTFLFNVDDIPEGGSFNQIFIVP